MQAPDLGSLGTESADDEEGLCRSSSPSVLSHCGVVQADER
ncbi:hypothetical protein [Pseudobacteroides cellulosolvens]|nr:hypothetical protein [Pseudobacteroides cellulosolvens]